jgi:rubrerythrin
MKKNDFENSQTKKNLEAAFGGESMANRKYLYFAKLAREMGDDEVAGVFEETAKQETEHAFSHLSLIYPKEKMTVRDLLAIAIEGERYEHTTMYPGFEKKALEEADGSKEHDAQFLATLRTAQKRFAALAKVEKIHADRYQSYLDRRKGK